MCGLEGRGAESEKKKNSLLHWDVGSGIIKRNVGKERMLVFGLLTNDRLLREADSSLSPCFC